MHVFKQSVPYYGISKNLFKVHMHACTLIQVVYIPSEMYSNYRISKNPTGFYNIHMHVYIHMSKLFVPTQMYTMDAVRHTYMFTCPSCPSPIPNILCYLKESHGIL